MIALLDGIYRAGAGPGLRLRLGSMGDPESRGPYRGSCWPTSRVTARRSTRTPSERMRNNPLRLFDTKDPGWPR